MGQAAVLARLTKVCLALPEATADDRHPPHRGFVVNKKNFVWFTANEHVRDSYLLQAPTRLTRLLSD